jgi:endogenous inhibitor of DNA gyrase (YacG/DUF329 family)
MTTETAVPPCPSCGASDPIRIVYGYPGLELGEAEGRGEIILGGCLVGPESPELECRRCGAALPWTATSDLDPEGE